MTDPKAPSPSDDDPSEDSPFGRDYLSDSDNEFLAELDRVLEWEARGQAQAPGPEGEMEVAPGEPEAEAEPEPEPELTGEPLAADTPLPPDDEVGSAEESGEEGIESVETAVQVNESTPFDEAWQELPESRGEEGEESEPRFDEKDWEEARAMSSDDTEPLEAAVAEEEMAEPAAEAEEADTELLPPAEQTPEPLPPEAAVEPAGAEADQKPGRDGAFWIWVGAAALLGLIGVTVGGIGLWQAGSMEERLNRLETAPKPAAVPKKDPVTGVNAERIGALEQRLGRELARLSADLKGVKSALNEGLESEKARLNEDLSGLNSTLTALQSELKSAEEMVAEADKRLQQAEEPKPAAAESPKQQELAAPGSAETAAEVKRTRAAPTAEVAKPAAKPEPEPAKAEGNKPGWAVNLWSFQRREKAEQELARVREQGISAEIFTINSKGKEWHRIGVGGFDSFDKANTYAKSIRAKPGLESAWIGRY